jgi:hypothetical protein
LLITVTGLEVLCPKSTPKEQLRQCHPIIVDILRNFFTFLVREKFYREAIDIAERTVLVSTAFDIESNMCKAMASITVLELTMGDVVQAQQTYLQVHLSNSQYIKSKECEMSDLLVMACHQQDMDLLDQAKSHPQLHFMDFEIQKLVKNISLFGFDVDQQPGKLSTTAPVIAVVDKLDLADSAKSKTSLFQTKKTIPAPPAAPTPVPPIAATNSSKSSSNSTRVPPPPPPLPPVHAAPVPAPVANEQESNILDELDGLEIDADEIDDELQSSPSLPQTHVAATAVSEEVDDDDELDLS